MKDSRDKYDSEPLLTYLIRLGLTEAQARAIHVMLTTWHASFGEMLLPYLDKDSVRISDFAIDEWEDFYASQDNVGQAIFQLVPRERFDEMRKYMRDKGSLASLGDFQEFQVDSELFRTPVAHFICCVFGPYLGWHLKDLWIDYQLALSGQEEAYRRLLEIDPLVRDLPKLDQVWGRRIRNCRNLKKRITYSQNALSTCILELMEKKTAGLDESDRLDLILDLWAKRKMRLVQQLRDTVENMIQKTKQKSSVQLKPSQVRDIFDLFFSGHQSFEVDPTLTPSSEAFRKDLSRAKKSKKT